MKNKDLWAVILFAAILLISSTIMLSLAIWLFEGE